MQAYRSIDCHRLLKLLLAGDLNQLSEVIKFQELQFHILRQRVNGPVRVTIE